MREHFIDIQEIRNNPNQYWDKYMLSYNKGLTIKDIDTLILPNSIGNWNWYNISSYINIQQFRDNPNKCWFAEGLSSNVTLTVKDIESFTPIGNDYWCWGDITEHINIQEVINNPNKPWVKQRLFHNKGITDKILEFFNAGLLKHLQMNIPKFQYHTDIVVKCEY